MYYIQKKRSGNLRISTEKPDSGKFYEFEELPAGEGKLCFSEKRGLYRVEFPESFSKQLKPKTMEERLADLENALCELDMEVNR